MKTLLMLCFPTLRTRLQPKVIPHDEANRDDRPTDNHQARVALLLALLFGFLRRAGGKLGGDLR